MQLEISPLNYGQRLPVTLPDTNLLSILKEEGIRKLISDHYDLLVKSDIKDLFPKNPIALDMAKEHSADFFIQVLGGPDYFNQNRGKPKLAQRHSRFKITPEAREVWLNCYKQILEKIDIPENLIISFWNYLNIFSNWMVNSPR